MDQGRYARLTDLWPELAGFAVVGGTVVVFGGYGPVLEGGEGEEQSLDDLFILRFLPRSLPEAG